MSGGFLKHGQTKKVYETLCSKTETSWKSKNINMHRFQKSSTSSQEMRNSRGIIREQNQKVTTSKVKSKTTQKRCEDNKEKRDFEYYLLVYYDNLQQD